MVGERCPSVMSKKKASNRQKASKQATLILIVSFYLYRYNKTIDEYVYCINYNCKLYLKMCLYITLMETFKRKCPCCNKTMELSKYLGDHKTCIICLEKARERYQENRETILRQCMKYRDQNTDKEKERHTLYN